MYVILGETGDTDYEELRSGTHKTVIIKGMVEKGSEELLRTSGGCSKNDVVPCESPFVTYMSREATGQEIADAIKQATKSAARM